MVLWAYSMLQQDAARKSGTDTPAQVAFSVTQGLGDLSNDNIVFLDGDDTSKIKAFLYANTGLPFLQPEADPRAVQEGNLSRSCDLRQPFQVLAAGVRILNHSFPDDSRAVNPLPLDAVLQQQQRLASQNVVEPTSAG